MRPTKCFRPRAEGMEQRTLFSASVAAGISLQTDKTGVASQLLSLLGASSPSAESPNQSGMVFDSTGRVAVEITAKNVTKILPALSKLGFVSTGAVPKDHLVDGDLPIAALNTIGKLKSAGLMGVLPQYAGHASAGNVDSEGDAGLEADRTRAATGYSGNGVTVGVLSSSYNDLGTASSGVDSGDLPGGVTVLQDLPSGGNDEGRAMLEIVHDLAPGAKLAFATAAVSETSFAQNILNLAKPVTSGGAGANVLVDDYYYDDEPYFQEGLIAQSIDTAAASSHVAYFSAAGNLSSESYQSSNVSFYTDTISGISASPQLFYNFNPTGLATDEEYLTMDPGQSISLGLQWDQPFYTTSGVTTDLNFYLLDDSDGSVVASSTLNSIANQEPYQQLNFTNTTGATTYYDLVISKSAGTLPKVIKYVNFSSSDYTYDEIYNQSPFQNDPYFNFSPTITPHAGSANAFAVAATPSYDQRTTELFTAEGPSTFLFSAAGGRLISPTVLSKPDASAIDAVSTSFFRQGNEGLGPNGYPIFTGTSAAAPHAAAVAALILNAHPTWTPAQIYSDLRSTADYSVDEIDNGLYGGAGLIDAYKAVVGTAVPANLPVNDGFESGYLGQDWATYNAGTGRTEVTSGNSPSSGTCQFVEDSNFDYGFQHSVNFFYPSLSEAILNFNASGTSNVMLSFDEKQFFGTYGTNQNTSSFAMPSAFQNHGDYDGVCFSVDGTNWYLIKDLSGTNSTANYQTFTVNLSQLAAQDGITLTSDTQIKFQHDDSASFTAPDGGYAFDNVKVFVPYTLTGQSFYLKFDADHQHLDIWNSTTNTGAANESVLLTQYTTVQLTGSGTGGSVTVDFGNGDPLPAGGLSLSGSATQTALLLIGDNSGDTVTIGSNMLSLASTFAAVPITFSNISAITFTSGTGSDRIVQTAQPIAPVKLAGSYSTDSLNVSGGTFTIPAATGGATPTVFALQSLSIGSGAKVTVASPLTHASRTLLKLNGLTLAGTTNAWLGLLDMTGNDLDLAAGGATGLATIYNQIKAGFFANPAPLEGITSSTAAADTTHATMLGSILNSTNGTTALYSTFDTATTAATDVLVKYTFFGDANLSGKVDGSDYSLIDTAYSHGPLTGWYNGDFNCDGAINGSDYSLIDNAFNRQGGSL